MTHERKPFLDLTRYHFKRHVGDLTIYGTWVPSSGGESEPAIAIIPRFREIGRPAVIALSAAYKYNEPAYAARAAHTFAVALGLEPGINTTLQIAGLIDDHLSDLISMPPEPTQAVVVADVDMTIGGKKRTLELLDHQGI